MWRSHFGTKKSASHIVTTQELSEWIDGSREVYKKSISLMLPYHLPSLCNTYMNLVCEFGESLLWMWQWGRIWTSISSSNGVLTKDEIWSIVKFKYFKLLSTLTLMQTLTKKRKQQQKEKTYFLNTNILSNISN